MVHYAHFEKEHRIENAILMFKTREASKLFLIILADFLSPPTDADSASADERGPKEPWANLPGHI